ncbi:MAG: hypothetical protein A3E82_06930 [Gammaproteobacteria bacterium RIFCSPHIGHO2_12_FULL_38_11]|nr:MAG: hypothetical protein A3E82_06930 [Gammaproteobacteria bacterium RIFCSPHIGHO2_12_FULL_38_11]
MFLNFWMHVLRCYSKRTPYVNKEKILNDVIISFTTTPGRIHKMWPTINSLLLQTQLPSKIFLWLPKNYHRFQNNFIVNIPNFLKDNPLIQIEFIEKDWGPSTKLLPYLEKFQNYPDTKIIVIDDDRIYPKTLIEDLVNYSNQYPQDAITIAAVVMSNSGRQEYTHSNKLKEIDVMLGYQGYLVKPRFFTPEIFNYSADCPEAFFEDDVWISANLKKNNIMRLMIPSRPGTQNVLTGNTFSSGLCVHENKDKRNFIKTWEYFYKKVF